MGNRTDYTITNQCGKVLENHHYTYNDSNQLVTEDITYGKRTTTVEYTYDADGNLISEVGRDGFAKVNTTYTYTVENRLEAVYDGRELLMAAAYDGDGNRVFQLNYDPADCDDYDGYDRFGCYGWYLHDGYGKTKDCGDDCNRTDKNSCGNRSAEVQTVQLADDRSGNGNQSCNSNLNDGYDNAGCDDKNHGYGNCGNHNCGNHNCGNDHGNHCGNIHGNHCGVIFPIHDEVSDTEEYLYSLVRNHGCVENYELTEYINDVNREYTEVLVEQNVWGHAVSTYTYGVDRLSIDNCINVTGYYLYDPRGSVTGITNAKGQIYQSYRYNANGEITYSAPVFDNEYTYNGESYNPNIESQYLRARYYNVTTAAFITEDSYLGDIAEPLTLNRYNYCVSSPLNYVDKSGHWLLEGEEEEIIAKQSTMNVREQLQKGNASAEQVMEFLAALHELGMVNASVDYALHFDYANNANYVNSVIAKAAERNNNFSCEIKVVGYVDSTIQLIMEYEGTPFLRPRINGDGSFTIGFGYDFTEEEDPEMFNTYFSKDENGNISIKREMTLDEAKSAIKRAIDMKNIETAVEGFISGEGYGNTSKPLTLNQNQYNALVSYFYNNGAYVFTDKKYEEWMGYKSEEYHIRAEARKELRDYLISANGVYDANTIINLFVKSKGPNLKYEYVDRRTREAKLFAY